MKIAYFGYNCLCSCLPVFVKHGHEIAVIFTGNDRLYADQVIDFSQQHGIPLVFDKPDAGYLQYLVDTGVECFFSAEYPWRIPIPDLLRYAINVHPTMLPLGRGPTPVSYMLLNDLNHAGVTLHKMTNKLDRGDILLQKAMSIESSDSYDTLIAKVAIETPVLLDKLLSDIDTYYANATEQQQGCYWPSLTRDDQTIHWDQHVGQILKQCRAFGRLGVYAEIDSKPVLITSAQGTSLDHAFAPGTLISTDQIQMVLAVKGGIISIAKSSVVYL